MALHPDCPHSPHAVLDPEVRWFLADEALRDTTMDNLQEDLDVPPKMERLAQWREDINRIQAKAVYDFVFVDDEGFKKYRPKTFKSLMDEFHSIRAVKKIINMIC